MKEAFYIHRDNGVLLKFPNGNTISSIWGPCTYSTNYNARFDFNNERQPELKSETVEVMVNCGNKLMRRLQKRHDTENSVFGNLDILEWLYVLNVVAKEIKEQ